MWRRHGSNVRFDIFSISNIFIHYYYASHLKELNNKTKYILFICSKGLFMQRKTNVNLSHPFFIVLNFQRLEYLPTYTHGKTHGKLYFQYVINQTFRNISKSFFFSKKIPHPIHYSHPMFSTFIIQIRYWIFLFWGGKVMKDVISMFFNDYKTC